MSLTSVYLLTRPDALPYRIERGMNMDAQRVYVVRAGGRGEDEGHALQSGVALVRFLEIPSLEKAQGRYDVLQIVKGAAPIDQGRRSTSIRASQLWRFLSMREGDLVLLPRKRTPYVAVGKLAGPYKYKEIAGEARHTRRVEWLQEDVPRTAFPSDLLASMRSLLTVFQVSRNDAVTRIQRLLSGTVAPSRTIAESPAPATIEADDEGDEAEDVPEQYDIRQAARDQIVSAIQERFTGHDMAALVAAVLRAEGWVAGESSPGPDGGVDILAGRGPLGLDQPRLCVQVKAQRASADVQIYRALQGTMQTFSADQGLLVCWGGFTVAARREARQGHFIVRLWDSDKLVEAVLRNYAALPAEIKAELPLEQEWILVADANVG